VPSVTGLWPLLMLHKQSDVVVGLPSDAVADNLDKTEPGWKISGKYVRRISVTRVLHLFDFFQGY